MKTLAIGVALASSACLGQLAAQDLPGTPNLTESCGDLPPLGAGPVAPLDWDPLPCPVDAQTRFASAVSVRTLKHNPPKAARKEFDHAIQAWRRGRTEDALNHMTEAVRLDPDFLNAFIELGAVYAKLGQQTLALEQFDRAAALEPNSAVLHRNRAYSLLNLNRPEDAEQAARRAIQLDPESVDANYFLV